MKSRNILIIDLSLGNLGSLASFFDREGIPYGILSSPPKQNNEFTHIVLPGVGSYRHGAENLTTQWRKYIQSTRDTLPLLGICLGMQLLSTAGNEACPEGSFAAGLDLIPGSVSRITIDDKSVYLPHMGWNSIDICPEYAKDPLFHSIQDQSDFYFVHSYCYQADSPNNIVATTNYGSIFPSIIANRALNVYGTQFHPEKSQRIGRQLLINFVERIHA